jgi:hypothetical protein
VSIVADMAERGDVVAMVAVCVRNAHVDLTIGYEKLMLWVL